MPDNQAMADEVLLQLLVIHKLHEIRPHYPHSGWQTWRDEVTANLKMMSHMSTPFRHPNH